MPELYPNRVTYTSTKCRQTAENAKFNGNKRLAEADKVRPLERDEISTGRQTPLVTSFHSEIKDVDGNATPGLPEVRRWVRLRRLKANVP